jgi:tetratricopeptide (TPR) repeat protein
MLNYTAEDSFRSGKLALAEGKKLEALALFEAAVELHRRLGTSAIPPRYLSYYGMCLTCFSGRHHDGIYFCREAIQKENYNPDLYLNLGKALLAAHRRREAHQTLSRGLEVDPENPNIARIIRSMGTRRRPPIPFLSRGNPLNVFLGKLTYPEKQVRVAG